MFRQYKNKTSVAKKRSRLLQGGDVEIKENKLGWWERKQLPPDRFTDTIIEVTSEYEKRPDLIANDFYGSSQLMWLVLQYNNIVDIEEELIKGKQLRLPDQNRLTTSIVTKNIKITNRT